MLEHLSGFSFFYGEVNRSAGLLLFLIIPIQPFAYVISYHILHYGDDKGKHIRQTIHPLSVTRIGAVTKIFFQVLQKHTIPCIFQAFGIIIAFSPKSSQAFRKIASAHLSGIAVRAELQKLM